MTHMSIEVIIYLKGLSVRHPRVLAPHSSLLDEWLRYLSNASPLLVLLREKSVPKVASSETDIDIIGQYC